VRRLVSTLMLVATAAAVAINSASAQGGAPMTAEVKARRWEIENELASLWLISGIACTHVTRERQRV
jgi:hypothetical protein